MSAPLVVSHADWLAARRSFLEREKAFTRERDALAAARRALPWERVEKPYAFDTPEGSCTLPQLFAGCSQLVVYHFMFGPDWSDGCPSCSFWADNFNGIEEHLRHRDIELIAVSRAPLDVLEAYRRRMGWSFRWVSSHGSEFNFDFQVSFTPEELARGTVEYNYAQRRFPSSEAPGISVFARDDSGAVFHTYSAFSRGLDIINGAYHIMDLVPKGRDEGGFDFPMRWLRRRGEYPPGRRPV